MDEEFRFKSSIKKEIVKIIITTIFIMILILIISAINIDFNKLFNLMESNDSLNFFIYFAFFFFSFFSTLIYGLINKKFKTFTISKKNGFQVDFKFIVNSNKSYKLDKMTSFELEQSFFDKLLDLGSISFGFFGKNIEIQQNEGVVLYKNQIMKDVENYREKFALFLDEVGLKIENEIYSIKPVAKIQLFFSLFFFIILTLLGISFLVMYKILVLIFPIIVVLVILSLISSISSFINYLKYKNMVIKVMPDYIKIEYSYIFGSKIIIVPIKNIINKEIEKKFIISNLFNVGNLKLYTGGNKDPTIKYISNYEELFNILENMKNQINLGNQGNLNNLNNNESSIINNINSNNVNNINEINNSSNNNSSVLNSNNNRKELLYETKSGGGYVLNLGNIITLIISLFIIFLLPIVISYLIYLHYFRKSLKYEFYEDGLIIKQGIFNKTVTEIKYSKIKQLVLRSKLFFERNFNQGNIYILTDGTGTADGVLYSIENYNDVYEELLNRIK